MKKFLIGIFVLLILAVVGAGAYVYYNGTTLIKQAILDYGPDMTGTTVTVDSVTLMPLTGKAGLAGLSVGTPRGYSAPYTFKANDISLSLKPKTLLDDVLVIDKVIIAAPSVVYEPKRKTSNIEALQKNIDAYIGPDNGEVRPGPSRVIINRFEIRQPQVVVYAGGLIGEQSVTAKDVVITNIGVKENGIPPGDVAEIVMAELQPQIISAIRSKAGKQLLNKALEEAMKKGLPVDDVKDLLGGKNVDETVKKGIGSFFKKLK